MIYQSRTPPRSNASTQLHLGPHFKHWSNCNQKYSKQNQETNTPMLCRFEKKLLDSSKTHHGRINHQSSWICTWVIFQTIQSLCDYQKILSQREKLRDLSIFSSLQTDTKNNFYTEFSAVTNWLAIYLIDYRKYVFTSFVPYSQLIH